MTERPFWEPNQTKRKELDRVEIDGLMFILYKKVSEKTGQAYFVLMQVRTKNPSSKPLSITLFKRQARLLSELLQDNLSVLEDEVEEVEKEPDYEAVMAAHTNRMHGIED